MAKRPIISLKKSSSTKKSTLSLNKSDVVYKPKGVTSYVSPTNPDEPNNRGWAKVSKTPAKAQMDAAFDAMNRQYAREEKKRRFSEEDEEYKECK